MRTLGIVGRPLGHSASKRLFEEMFSATGLSSEYRYLNFPLENISDLGRILAEYPDLAGFNVTIPYKKEIMARLDRISDEARAIGAVNCVKVEGGRLCGYNTDAYGFAAGLDRLLAGTERKGLGALVLGTGGAASAVRYVLEREGIEYRMVSRSGGRELLSYGELTVALVEGRRLIVNTTPLGMFPHTSTRPDIPYEGIGAGHFLYDLVYNPAETAFLKEGARRGAAILNGEEMLLRQAEKSWTIWNNG